MLYEQAQSDTTRARITADRDPEYGFHRVFDNPALSGTAVWLPMAFPLIKTFSQAVSKKSLLGMACRIPALLIGSCGIVYRSIKSQYRIKKDGIKYARRNARQTPVSPKLHSGNDFMAAHRMDPVCAVIPSYPAAPPLGCVGEISTAVGQGRKP